MKSAPLGTLVASVLTFKRFSKAANDEPAASWSAQSSVWAPADGREVFGSKYEEAGLGTQVPDLRGGFARGRNQFDRREPEPCPSHQMDPDGIRDVGSFQADAFAEHEHPYKDRFPGGDGKTFRWGEGGSRPYADRVTEAVGGPETRPKNVAVCFYIRIN